MHDLLPYGAVLLVMSIAALAAIASSRLSEWTRVPAPALFLIVAAVASDLLPDLGGLDVVTNQRLVTVALVVILFDGGMHIGWGRMRPNVGAVAWIGVAGTLV